MSNGRIEIVIEFTDNIDWRVLNRALMKFGRVSELREDGQWNDYPDPGYGFGLLVPGTLSQDDRDKYKITHNYFVAHINEDKFDAFKHEVMMWNGVKQVVKCDADFSTAS